jgi:hypothetical protein
MKLNLMETYDLQSRLAVIFKQHFLNLLCNTTTFISHRASGLMDK